MILVFGKTGQVALELARIDAPMRFLGRDEADLTDPETCAQLIAVSDASAVINAAAYTAVDAAETDQATAKTVNADAPEAMARAAARKAIPFVQISTDYVFDGSGHTPWLPNATTAPLGVYGATKLAGEKGVRNANGPHAILRTSWVFSAHGTNFVKTMLRLSETRDALTVVGDQIGGPTPAAGIAKACVAIATALTKDHNLGGTYHYSGAPDVSWADFARKIFELAGRKVQVTDIPTSAYPTAAKRPGNSRLNCATTAAVFDIERPDWPEALRHVLKELNQ